jgi:MSHA biogenesis protein MshG
MAYRFRYKAVSPEGNIQKGYFEAEDIQTAKRGLDLRGLIPISVESDESYKSFFKKYFKPSVNLEILLAFTKKFNTLLKAGIPILRTLDIIENEQENTEFSLALQKIKQLVESGISLSQAMQQFPEYFSSLYVSTVKAGEVSGQMDIVLDRMCELIERELKTKEMIKSAIRYPIYVMITIMLAIAVIVTVVVPKFADFYKFYQSDLPLPTRIISEFSSFVSSFWYLIIFIGIIAIFSFKRFSKSSLGQRIFDWVKLEMPILGNIFLQLTISRFCYVLATLVRSGLPLVESLSLVGTTVGNSIIAKVIASISDNVRGGGDIFGPMRKSKYFKPMVIQMFVIGMESGNIDNMLFEVAHHYDESVEYQSKKLASRLEPIMTLFIGGMVLMLALAIFLPMWNMIQVFKK